MNYLFRWKTLTWEWVYGSLHVWKSYWITTPSIDERKWLAPFRPHEVLPQSVWQWTGLVDKNNIKMFFSDFVKKDGDDRIYQIAHDIMGGAYPHHDDIYNSFWAKCSIDFYPVTGVTNICIEWEVIWNLVDNPNL